MTISNEQIVQWLQNSAAVMAENKEYLTQLDSLFGGADHGINMNRGFNKVIEKLPTVSDKDIGSILKTAGMALISSVGGASGPLYGTFFTRSGAALSAKEELSSNDLHLLFQTGVEGIQQRGRAQRGDKTMYDAWLPSLEALKAATDNGQSVASALEQAVSAAKQGMEDTIPLQAKKGRASYLGERSIGHQDPGATSSYLLLKALLDTISADE
ncbi:MAG: dihydroxyacetone kinase ADP-binding subunit DhaL [Chloroflexales bacterium]|nr:dihydroxyacetone kinase ADP-binding subunit DhaL [Chloroflexales bacterium]